MSDIVLSVEVRERTGKGGARQTRRQGDVPGVLYGGDLGPIAIAMKQNEVVKAINSGNFIGQMIEIDHKGDRQNVITRDVQFHPVRDEPLHIDFYRVEEDSIIAIEVAVRFINEEDCPGLKRGGVLNIVRHTVEVNCPAGAIPEAIEVDLTGYDIGDSVHISSIALPDNVTPTITDRDFTIVTVQGSRAVIEEDTEDSDAEAEGEGEAESASEGED
ncbi:MAG: 50S ribosomal protein L25/general stress protein Ctc [Pseudomonadota bacterium]